MSTEHTTFTKDNRGHYALSFKAQKASLCSTTKGYDPRYIQDAKINHPKKRKWYLKEEGGV